MSERTLAEGWRAGHLAIWGGGQADRPSGLAIIWNAAHLSEWYPYDMAPDRCFAPEPQFKVGDWVANGRNGAYGRVTETRSAEHAICVQHLHCVTGDWRPSAHYELIERPNPCGNS